MIAFEEGKNFEDRREVMSVLKKKKKNWAVAL